METMPKTTPRSYEDFQPSFGWDKEEGSETLIISLPGFTKEQLKVQMDNLGNLKIGGERPLAGERWSRFRKDFRVPENTSTADIRAKLENGNLHVKFPKLSVRPRRPDQPTKAEPREPGPRTRDGQDRKDKVEDQSHKSEEKQVAGENGKRDAELANARKRKATAVDEETAAIKPTAGGLEARFKKPRQLMLNVGVAVVILVGLILCASFKLRKSMDADGN